ncbi:MAG: tRNA pseudouridine(38-40) synthase TruA [Flavobacteriales bacterium]|nr:tRNA pseudouridine(38-40) synthase TruA [Flavobacteriales bacterium]
MARYFIRLSYEGTNYHGWQVQDNVATVQAEINKALPTITGTDISCTGCGRTDTGVHASDFYAHFDLPTLRLRSVEPSQAGADKLDLSHLDFIYKVNGCLPGDIAVHELYEVAEDANTRFDATSRSYIYKIITRKDVFVKHAYFHYKEMNLEDMNSCTKLLLNHTDFSCFSKAHTQTHTNDCDITVAAWVSEGTKLEFRITANRFLRGMVRAIVGTLLEVGEGKISLDDFKTILADKDRSNAGYSVPAQGLFLTRVEYPKGYFEEN